MERPSGRKFDNAPEGLPLAFLAVWLTMSATAFAQGGPTLVTNAYNIGVINSDGGLLSSMAYTVQATTTSILRARYQAGPGHGSPVRMHFYRNGTEVAVSGEVLASQFTDWYDLGPVASGTYTVDFRAGVAPPTMLTSWAGQVEIIVSTSPPEPPTIVVQPFDSLAVSGSNTSFSVTATGTPPLNYQWRFNSTDLPSATNATLSLTNVQAGQAGGYSVAVSNPYGTNISATGTLTVVFPPTISVHPVTQFVRDGTRVTFSVTAQGTGLLNYQWRRDGTNLNGKIGSSLEIAPARVLDSGRYDCVVTNLYGMATSQPAALAIIPFIVENPTGVTVTVGGTVSLTVQADGTPPLAYQWEDIRGPIAGANSASLTLTNVVEAGNYRVVVTNIAGRAETYSASVGVLFGTPPFFFLGPSGQSVVAGGSVTFRAVPGGSPPFAYQWRKNGAALTGQTGDRLILSGVQAGDAGAYSVFLTSPYGFATSVDAALTVTASPEGPSIVAGPQNQTVPLGGRATFQVTTSGTSPLYYQWRKNGVAIPHAVDAAITIGSAQPGDAASYDVEVRNGVGSVTSGNATLTVDAGQQFPTLTNVVLDITFTPGQAVTLNAGAVGTEPLGYQWQQNGVALNSATNATLLLTNLTAAHAGSYSVAVTNALGGTVGEVARLRMFGDLRLYAGMFVGGVPGERYRIDYADVVNIGTTNWQVLTNLTLPASSYFVVDPNSPGQTRRFYRSVPVP